MLLSVDISNITRQLAVGESHVKFKLDESLPGLIETAVESFFSVSQFSSHSCAVAAKTDGISSEQSVSNANTHERIRFPVFFISFTFHISSQPKYIDATQKLCSNFAHKVSSYMGKIKIFCRIFVLHLQNIRKYNRIYKIFFTEEFVMNFKTMSKEKLEEIHSQLIEEYNSFKAKNLKLDMSRGKPCTQQLDLSMDMLKINDVKAANGLECRNYGILDGIPECKAIFSEMLEVEDKNVIVMGNSSLNVMFDYVSQCMTHGAGEAPWMQQGKIKFLCPVPGYDRHFAICEYFGIEMINVPMIDGGPDVGLIEELIKDSSVKGMFCVPKYSNPDGRTYSDDTVRRIAALKPAAKDFRIIWDNAYIVHDLRERGDRLLNIFPECEKNSTEDMVIEVVSTSKVTFSGAGIAALAASDKNVEMIKKRMKTQTIGYDKINQLRHAKFLKNMDGVRAHMKKQAEIIAPKFDVVLKHFDENLSGKGIAEWTDPNGGYFISLNVMDGCAKRTVELCKEAGVVLTPAGATYPYGRDPRDSNIRIAPTFPPVEELELAVDLLCICIQIAAAEKLINE